MGSHKQRVQRKIKKEVKRKIQAKQRPSHAQQTQNKMDEMMKMLLMLKGGQQQNPNAAQDLLTAKEIIAKQNAEEARKQRELQASIKQIKNAEEEAKMKAKTQCDEEEVKHLRNKMELEKQIRETKAKLKEAKNEKEIAELNDKAASLQQQYDLEEKYNELRLEAEGLGATNAEKKHKIEQQRGEIKQMQLKLQNKQKEFEIEDLDAKSKELSNKLTEIKVQVESYDEINGRGSKKYKEFIAGVENLIDTLNNGAVKSMAELSDIKDQMKNLEKYTLDKKIKGSNEYNTQLKKSLRGLRKELEDLTEDNEHLHALKKENKHLQRDIANTQYNINLENSQTRTNDKGELQIKVYTGRKNKDGKPLTEWKNVEKFDIDVDEPVERNIAKDLETAEVDNKQYKTIKKQKDAEYDRNEKDLLKIDELNAENTKTNAYNDAMGSVEYDDKSAEIAKLEYEIKELQEKINDKYTSKADYNKMLRHIKELENKKTALEKELGMTPTKTITDDLIKQQAQAMYNVAETEGRIKTRRTKNEATENFANETEKLNMDNKVKQELIKKMDGDVSDENIKKMVTNRVDAKQKEKQLAAEQEARDAEEKLAITKWEEEALNSKQIKATNEKIKQAHINKAVYEEEAKQRERLRNAQQNALNAKVMAEVQAELNPSFTSAQSVSEAETLFKQANDKYDRAINDMKSESDYVHDKANSIMARLTIDAPLRQRVAGILDARGYDIDNQDWFNKNLTNRIRADAFANAVDSVFSHYDQEHQVWDDEAIEADDGIGKYLDEGGFNNSA